MNETEWSEESGEGDLHFSFSLFRAVLFPLQLFVVIRWSVRMATSSRIVAHGDKRNISFDLKGRKRLRLRNLSK